MGRRSNLSQITAYILPVIGSHPSQDDLNRFSRSSCRRCSVKTSVLKNFADFTGKQLGWSLLIKLKASNFIKKRLQHRYFSLKFAKISRTFMFTIFKSICEQLLLVFRTQHIFFFFAW